MNKMAGRVFFLLYILVWFCLFFCCCLGVPAYFGNANFVVDANIAMIDAQNRRVVRAGRCQRECTLERLIENGFLSFFFLNDLVFHMNGYFGRC